MGPTTHLWSQHRTAPTTCCSNGFVPGWVLGWVAQLLVDALGTLDCAPRHTAATSVLHCCNWVTSYCPGTAVRHCGSYRWLQALPQAGRSRSARPPQPINVSNDVSINEAISTIFNFMWARNLLWPCFWLPRICLPLALKSVCPEAVKGSLLGVLFVRGAYLCAQCPTASRTRRGPHPGLQGDVHNTKYRQYSSALFETKPHLQPTRAVEGRQKSSSSSSPARSHGTCLARLPRSLCAWRH